MFQIVAKRKRTIWRVSVIISFLRIIWRAKKKTPLGAVLDAPSGYMTARSAEQKIFDKVKIFWLRWLALTGIPKGYPLGSVFVPLGRAKGTARAA